MGNFDSLGIPDDLGRRVEDWSMVKGEIAGFQWLNVTWGRLLALLVRTA